MILTPHMAAGTALALAIHPALGIPLAVLSHYILDALPHAEYNIDPIKNLGSGKIKEAHQAALRIMLDGGGGFIAAILVASVLGYSPLLAAAGAIAGILPDGLTMLLIVFPKNKPLQKHWAFHSGVHFPKNKKPSQFLRVGLQLAAIILTVLVLWR